MNNMINENEAPFKFIAAFCGSPEIIALLMSFMERTHFTTMRNTEQQCFSGNVEKVFTPNIRPGADSVTYTHGLVSEEKWKLYNDEYRQTAKDEFSAEFGKYIESGELTVVSSVGYPTAVMVQFTKVTEKVA